MQTVIYSLWGLFTSIFFLMALWTFLEKVSGRDKRDQPWEYLKQGFFVLACVGVSFLIDNLFLEDLVSATFGDMIPLGFFQILLLPFVLLTGAKLIGGSKPILITKSQNFSTRNRYRGKK